MTQEQIHVVIRFRPVNKREKKEAKKSKVKDRPIIFQNNDEKRIGAIEICSTKSKDPVRFTFDRILDHNVSQEETFTHVAQKVCSDGLAGYNGCVFAFGQTGSGKTYTMFGPEDVGSNPELMGLIPRSVSYIFSEIDDDPDIIEARVKVSFVEIYKEKLRDLLNPSSKKQLKIKMKSKHETMITNLTETNVSSLFDVLKLIEIANNYRTKAETSMNQSSSRSHMLMVLTVTIKIENGSIRIGKINFCDLAGSEKVRKTNATGNRLKEAQKINLSLTVLGQVISSLSDRRKHVPYRDSKLTHVLKDSLGGNCKTTLIVNASKHIFNRDETITSLRFGSRCKLITNQVKVNKIYNRQQLMVMVNKLKQQNSQLTLELTRERTVSVDMRGSSYSMSESVGGFDPSSNMLFAKKDNAKVEKIQSEKNKLLAQIEEYKSKMNELDQQNQYLKSENVQLEENRHKMVDTLEQNQNELQRLNNVIMGYQMKESEYKQSMDHIEVQNEQLKLQMKSIQHRNREYEMQLENMKKDKHFEASNLNKELAKFKELHQDVTDETAQLLNEIEKLKDASENSQLIIDSQDSQLNRNREEIDEFEKQLIRKDKLLSKNETELKNVTLKLAETESSIDQLKADYDQTILSKNEEISLKDEEIEKLTNELEDRTQRLTDENHKLAQQIEETEINLNKLSSVSTVNNQVTFSESTHPTSVEQIIKTASLVMVSSDYENEQKKDTDTKRTSAVGLMNSSKILSSKSIYDNVAYLKNLESKRITKRYTTILNQENAVDFGKNTKSNPVSSEDKKRNRFYTFKKFYDPNNLSTEKSNVEGSIGEKQKKLDLLRITSLPNDGNQRMNILIDIAMLEDDIGGLKQKLGNINKKILKKKKKKRKQKGKNESEESDKDVAVYQDAIYGNKQPMMRYNKEKSVEISEEKSEVISKVTTMSELDQNMDTALQFSETLYPDFEVKGDENDRQLLEELTDKLKNGLEIKDRRYLLNSYPQCFIGKEAVTYMIENDICKSREEAVVLGKMLQSSDIIRHVIDDREFKDEKLYYRFVNDEGYIEI